MDIRKPKELKQAAAQRLRSASGDPRMLVLLHTAVALGIGLLVTVLDFVLTRSIDATGGLSGLQLRSILSTIRSVLQMVNSVLLPFWQIGLLRAAMAFARQEHATPSHLLAGFRRFGPAMWVMLLRIVVVGAIVMFCTYAATAIFLATPLSRPAIDLLTPILSEGSILTDPTAALDDATIAAIADTVMLPLIPILMLLMAALALPLLYRLRLAEYVILDGEPCGALQALGKSLKLTRRNAFALFRIDLSFWWFYLLQGLCTAVGFADVLLSDLGIALPISQDSAFFVCYILSLFLQLALYWYAGAYVHTTRALTYDILNAVQEPPAPQPKNVPWDY